VPTQEDDLPQAVDAAVSKQASPPERLIEREAELATLDRMLEGARAGYGRVAIIRGPAGIGKTRLLRELRGSAQGADLTTLAARAGELERDFPFGCVRQLFESLILGSGQRRDALFAGDARLAEAVFASPSDDSVLSPDPGYGTLHGLYWLTANLAERSPLLITLDDAHWADPASLRYLAFLARRLDGVPALVAITMRPAERGAETDLLRELSQDPSTEPLDLAPLSQSAVAEVIRAHLDGEAAERLRVRCHEATGGNPFLVRETLRDLERDPRAIEELSAERIMTLAPERVAEAVIARLKGVGTRAPGLAHAVAVLGDGAELRRAAALADLDPDAAAGDADGLADAGILEPGRPLRFLHPIVRNAVYNRMPPAERDRWRRRAAALLSEAGESAEAVSLHLLATEPGGRPEVVELLRQAAHAAGSRGAPDAAVAFLRRAMSEPPPPNQRGAILTELGAAELMSGAPEAVGHMSEAMELAEDAGQRAAAARWLGQGLVLSGRPEEAIQVIGDAASDLPDDSELAHLLEGDMFVAGYVNLAARRRAIARYPTPRHLAETGGAPLLAAAANETALTDGPAEEAANMALRALDGGRLLREQGPESPAFFMAPNALLYSDRLEDAARVYDEVSTVAGERGSQRGYLMALCWRAGVNCRRGSISDAVADARAFLDADLQDLAVGIPVATAFLIDALIDRGELDAAGALLEQTAPRAQLVSGSVLFNLLIESRGKLKIARGEVAAGLEDLRECGRREAEWGIRTPAMTLWRAHAAQALVALGERDEARRLTEEEVTRARAFGAPRALGIALRAAALVREDAERIELLRDAVATLESSSARVEHARSLIDLGAALRRSGQQAEARELLRDGLELAHGCGATALANFALDELVAAGARPRHPTSDADALTPSERRISEMAAKGMANKEIAQALFVTVKTVETHLGHAYSKLGIHSRSQLTARLSQIGCLLLFAAGDWMPTLESLVPA
jgi:DNA-binding CsgD family transcriptional regulator